MDTMTIPDTAEPSRAQPGGGTTHRNTRDSGDEFVACWHEDARAFDDLSGEWNDLLARSPANNVFLTLEWIKTWWEHFAEDSRLAILTLRDREGMLRGIAPLQIVRTRGRFGWVRRLEFIGHGGAVNPDHLDFIFEPNTTEAAMRATFAAIMERSADWDLIHLTDLWNGSASVRAISVEARRHRLDLRASRKTICPYFEIEGTFEEFIAGLGKRLRKEFRSDRRKIEREHETRIVAYEEPGSTARGMDDLASLHQKRMQDTQRGGNFRNDAYTRFNRAIAEKFAETGWLMLQVLELDGEPAAVNYGFVYGRTWYGYQMGLDPKHYRYSLGTVLLGLMIEQLIDRGINKVDMLRGRSDWKYRWAKDERENWAYVMPRPGLAGRWKLWSHQLSGGYGVVLKRILPATLFDSLRRRFGKKDRHRSRS